MAAKFSILLLCGNTNRAKSYIHVLQKLSGIEVKGLLYGVSGNSSASSGTKVEPNHATSEYLSNLNIDVPDFNIPIEESLQKAQIEFNVYEERDVNSQLILSAIGKYDVDYVVFAGYGGQILSEDHFKGSKRYIHCHPGWLPQERGSTTIYYSILMDRNPSVTVFFMSAEIDKGQMILRKSFQMPDSMVDIDFYVDNLYRSESLFEGLIALIQEKDRIVASNDEEDQEYYVIHPLLKHISLMSLDS